MLLLLFYSQFASAQTYSDSDLTETPGELLVRLHPDASEAQLETLSGRLGAESVTPVFLPTTPAGQDRRLRSIYRIRFPEDWQLEPIRQRYETHPAIAEVEVNRLNRLCSDIPPNDPSYAEQWNLNVLKMSDAWRVARGTPDVIVAVVDSGIATRHPEFRNQLWENSGEIPENGVDDDGNGYVDDRNGWDFSDAPTLPGGGDFTIRDNDPEDETGHGTHVAGIIAAAMNNGIGVAGIAPNCRLMPLRAGFKFGGGTYLQNDDLAAAIVYAADNGARVINMSWGDTVRAFIIADAVEYAAARGCVLVGAAGNASAAGAYYPAALNSVISVAGIGAEKQLYNASNYGALIDIAAPAEAILSTALNDGYEDRSGTSMAAAHVSGVAALLLSATPDADPTAIRARLIATAQPLFSPELVGAGSLDAATALAASTSLVVSVDTQPTPESLEIFGSAGGIGFTAYWLEYGIGEVPDLWYPLGTPQTVPKFNTCLYKWDTSVLAEGRYTLRLSVEHADGGTQRVKTVVDVGHTPPLIVKHEAQPWLSGGTFSTAVLWETDMLTTGRMEIVNSNGDVESTFYSDAENQLHILSMSDIGVAPGVHMYRLVAENRTRLLQVADNSGGLHQVGVTDMPIPVSHLSQVASTAGQFHAVAAPIDINGNGRVEVFTVEMETGSAQIIEITEAGTFEQVFSFPDSLWPWAVADTDNDGLIEILCNGAGTAFLLEQPTQDMFPTARIWEAPGHWSRTIVDADADGIPEIFARNDTANAISVYEAVGDNDYRKTATLTDPTWGHNGIRANFATADFDGDGRMEILAGDTDGRVFIYEANGDNRYIQTWLTALPEGTPHLFAAGDLDNDGIPEFAVSVKTGERVGTTALDIRYSHARLTIFKAVSDNTYTPGWTQRIREVRDSGSGMIIADANNDGQNELCIVEPPNVYLLHYDGINYRPIWHHAATGTFNPIVMDLNGSGTPALLFNTDAGLTVFEAPAAGSSLPISSAQLQATPVDARSVHLTWQPVGDGWHYTLYRGEHEDILKKIREGLRETDFTDTGLTTGRTYWYAIAAQDSGGRFSGTSAAISVVPTPRPRVHAAAFLPPNQVIVTFDKPMGVSAMHAGRYQLQKEGGAGRHTPRSAILDKTGNRVVLTFFSAVFDTGVLYQIEASGLSDIYGAPLALDARTAAVALPAPTLAAVVVYPNPAEACHRVTFEKLPLGTHIDIYDASGNRVASFDRTEQARDRRVWEVSGVSSGVYIYRLSVDTEQRIGKLAVIR